MSRYTGPAWKLGRRLNYSTIETGKDLAKRPYGPGKAKDARPKKLSEYGKQLTEKKNESNIEKKVTFEIIDIDSMLGNIKKRKYSERKKIKNNNKNYDFEIIDYKKRHYSMRNKKKIRKQLIQPKKIKQILLRMLVSQLKT